MMGRGNPKTLPAMVRYRHPPGLVPEPEDAYASDQAQFCASKDAWPQRLHMSDISSDSLFPIPPIGRRTSGGGVSSSAAKRVRKYDFINQVANDCISCVNELFGCDHAHISNSVDKPVLPSYKSIHANILEAVLDSFPESPIPTPRVASREVFGRRLDYVGGRDNSCKL